LIIGPEPSIEENGIRLEHLGFKPMDALHLSCALSAGCQWFFTTDKGILNKRSICPEIVILNPLEYIEIEEQAND